MATNFELMPLSLVKKLQGLSINEALQNGIITHVGDESGNFIFADGEKPDVYYALIESYIIRCSENVVNANVPIDSIAGGLIFYKHFINGEETLKIGLPHTINLGKVIFQINKAD